jgi:1-deoxy-D-xylulose-5-phosphate reductoisomerase
MRLPIQYAFSYPERWRAPLPSLDLVRAGRLDFEAADPSRFRCLALAFRALRGPEGLAVVLNAANEVAVSAFLHHRIAFPAIAAIIEQAMDEYERRGIAPVTGLAEVRAIDAWARDYAVLATAGVQSTQ